MPKKEKKIIKGKKDKKMRNTIRKEGEKRINLNTIAETLAAVTHTHTHTHR